MLFQLLFGMKLLSAEIQQSGTSKQGILGYLPNDIKKEMKRTKETVILPVTRTRFRCDCIVLFKYNSFFFFILICRRAIFAIEKVQTFVAVKNHVNYHFTWRVALKRAVKINFPACSNRIVDRIFESMSQLMNTNQMKSALFVMTKWVNIIPSIQSNHRVAVKTLGIIKNA